MRPRPVPGSFRDPRARVLDDGERILRVLDQRGADDFATLEATRFYEQAQRDGTLVGTRRADEPTRAALAADGWCDVLEHDRIPVVNYPYEWTFSMRRDAALAHLEVVGRGLAEGISCKDGSAYNVQFVGCRPTFIDVGSFQPVTPDPWPGYRQFCGLLLFPLLLEAHLGIDVGPWLRGSIDGISLDDADRLLRGARRRRAGVLTHVAGQAWAARRFAERPDPAERLVRGTDRAVAVTRALVERTARLVADLPAPDAASPWSGYGDRDHYRDGALAAKDEFVGSAIAAVAPDTVIDLGCNDGRYAEVAARQGASVVALDVDRQVVDRLYRRIRTTGLPILPMVADLADPSPGLGWDLTERVPLAERVDAELALSLALVHHLVIGRNVPVDRCLATLARQAPATVLEVPHRADPMVARLLAAAPPDVHDEYHHRAIRDLIADRFWIDEELTLPGGTRTLYRLRRRTAWAPTGATDRAGHARR